VNGHAIGVVRPHAPQLVPGPRPRLRPALERAVSAVEERLGGRSRIIGSHPIELVWGRLSPMTVLRDTRVQPSWHVSSSLVVHVNGGSIAPSAEPPAREVSVRDAATLPMRLATIERRIETRVVGRALAALTDSARQPFAEHDVVPTSATAASPEPVLVRARVPDASIQARLPPPEMAVARLHRSPSVATTTPPSAPALAASPTHRSSTLATAPAVPPLPIDRITTEVVRALDSRFIAWRERMGRL